LGVDSRWELLLLCNDVVFVVSLVVVVGVGVAGAVVVDIGLRV